MAPEERTDRLERTAGRTSPPPSSRTRPRTRHKRRRRGPIAAGVLVAALALAWLLTSRAAAPPAEGARPPTAASAPAFDTAPLAVLLGRPHGCDDVSLTVPELRCEIDGVRVEARLVDPADVDAVFATTTGAHAIAGTGRAACEQGRPDNRTWSRAAKPTVAVGRYVCRFEDGNAAIWWSDQHGLVAHAVAADHDLARLFAWWRAHLDQ